MSKKTTETKKTVKITENELVNLIDNIVSEAVAEQKKVWIAENETKGGALLESRIKDLESKIAALPVSKK
jgi:hypothetical protein